jgi:hypothetical protein
MFYLFQKIVGLKGTAELIQNLQELASKGVLLAEKVGTFENFACDIY